jgi:hypothetical protein
MDQLYMVKSTKLLHIFNPIDSASEHFWGEQFIKEINNKKYIVVHYQQYWAMYIYYVHFQYK